jgi:hypothetical protein
VHCASWIDAVLGRKHQRVVGSGRGLHLRQLARRSRDLGDLGAKEEEEWETFLNNRYQRQLRRHKAGPVDYSFSREKVRRSA